MLEYVHGGLELVEPNTIQEAILSCEQVDDEGRFWKFDKILKHRIVTNGKIEVQVLWDNGETTWEPLLVIRKDNPVTVAAYAKEKNLLKQRGSK